MTTYTAVSGMVAKIRTKIVESTALRVTDDDGTELIPQMLDRDEDPAVIADSPKGLPAICVILIGDKPDQIRPYISSYDWEHTFNVVVVGYYRATQNELRGEDIYDDIGTLRQKAYDCAELFKGNGAWFNPGVVKESKVELGYQEIVDYVVYRFVVTLTCSIWEV